MHSHDYNLGYGAGYEKACTDMLFLIQGKVRETRGVNSIDQMHGRGPSSEVVGAKGIPYGTPEFDDYASMLKSATGPQGYTG